MASFRAVEEPLKNNDALCDYCNSLIKKGQMHIAVYKGERVKTHFCPGNCHSLFEERRNNASTLKRRARSQEQQSTQPQEVAA